MGKMFYRLVNTLIILVLIAMILSAGICLGQDFPYMVPEAPEFESSGGLVKPPSSATQSEQKKPFRSNAGVFRPQMESGAINPSQVPEAPISSDNNVPAKPGPVRAPAVVSQPAPPVMSPPAQGPVASAPPAGVGVGARPRSDCSEFPMMIARSRSDAEMQMTARHYLTCLMQGGWSMEQAREQVIRTIETAYRPSR